MSLNNRQKAMLRNAPWLLVRRPPVGSGNKPVRKTHDEWMAHYAKLLGNTVAEDDAPPPAPDVATVIKRRAER